MHVYSLFLPGNSVIKSVPAQVCGFPTLGVEGTAKLLFLTGLSSDIVPTSYRGFWHHVQGLSLSTYKTYLLPILKHPLSTLASKLHIILHSVDCSLCFLEGQLSVPVGCMREWAQLPPISSYTPPPQFSLLLIIHCQFPPFLHVFLSLFLLL